MRTPTTTPHTSDGAPRKLSAVNASDADQRPDEVEPVGRQARELEEALPDEVSRPEQHRRDDDEDDREHDPGGRAGRRQRGEEDEVRVRPIDAQRGPTSTPMTMTASSGGNQIGGCAPCRERRNPRPMPRNDPSSTMFEKYDRCRMLAPSHRISASSRNSIRELPSTSRTGTREISMGTP